MRWGAFVVAIAACGGDDAIAIKFAKPAMGENFVRDGLGPTGALSALVPVDLDVNGAPTRISLAAGPRALADLAGTGDGTADIRTLGAVTLTANAYDGDAVVASAMVDINVTELSLASCHDWLDLYGVEFTAAGATPGVVDPVTAKVPINGVPFKVSGNTNPRSTMFGDCRLIKSVAEAAASFRDRDIELVTDLGIYNYRCIGGVGTPPNCPNGISQHAYAMAIDLAEFTTKDGTVYSVLDDWIIDPDSEETCAAPTEPGKDQFLHELICELKARDVWTIVLTPNYNADHRNHFHVDLTPMSDFIERRETPPIYGD
jgi:hypothetical protein